MDLARPITSVIPGLPGRVLGVLGRTNSPLTGRAIAKAMAPPASQAGVAKVLDAFVRDGIVVRTEAGASAQYVLNREHVAAPLVEGLAELRATFLERLTAAVEGLRPPPLSAYLYGSAARGDGDSASDIDIALVVSDEMKDTDAWDAATAELRRRVHAMTGNDVSLIEYRLPELFDKHDDWAVRTLAAEGIRLAGASVDDLRRRWQALDARSRHAAMIGRELLLGDEPADAVDPLLRAREAYRTLGDRYGEASVLEHLVEAYSRLSRWTDADAVLSDAIGAFRTLGDDAKAANAIVRRAHVLARTGRHGDAIEEFRSALTVGRRMSQEWRGRVHGALAVAYVTVGDGDTARTELKRAVRLLRAAHATEAEADTLLLLADLVRHSDVDAADAAARRACSLFEDSGYEAGLARSLLNLGRVRAAQGEPAESRRLYEEALTTFRRTGHAHGEAVASWLLGEALRDLGRAAESIDVLRRAADQFRALGRAHDEGVVWEVLGSVYAANGDRDEALDAYRRALDVFRQTGDQMRTRSALDALAPLEMGHVGAAS